MINSAVLDVIISLSLIYFLLSNLVISLNEILMYFSKSRGKFLLETIEMVLNDNKLNKNFALLVYENPQIDLLRKTQKEFPAYIPAENFATALIDIICEEGIQTVFNKNNETGEVTFKELFRDKPPIDRFIEGVEKLNHSDLKILLRTFVNQSFNSQTSTYDFEKLNSNIINWYNGYMDRVGGWFKNKQRPKLFFIGFIVALVLNIDSIKLFKELSKNKQLTESLVKEAIEVAKNETYDKYYKETYNTDTTALKLKNIGAYDKNLKIALKKLDVLELPIGWEKTNLCSVIKDINTLDISTFFKEGYLIGWLITAFSLMLGAPFWFDVLKNIVNIRSTGKKPQ